MRPFENLDHEAKAPPKIPLFLEITFPLHFLAVSVYNCGIVSKVMNL
jgi:hypothetical protein